MPPIYMKGKAINVTWSTLSSRHLFSRRNCSQNPLKRARVIVDVVVKRKIHAGLTRDQIIIIQITESHFTD
jgi:hypothetical protein